MAAYRFSLWSSIRNKWVQTSEKHLKDVEAKILKELKSTTEDRLVLLPTEGNKIQTIIANKHKPNTPLVMIHGMAGGLGLWVQNIDALAENRPVYAFDLLGFGRSSRPTFKSSSKEVEKEFVESIEEWRQEMGIEKMALLGHSLGGYLASAYALQYPNRIEHLFVVDPWGFPAFPRRNRKEISFRIPTFRGAIVLAVVHSPFNPFAIVRLSGPFGPFLIRWFQSEMRVNYKNVFEDTTIQDYFFHCNAQTPSGEAAFWTMTAMMGYAKEPMVGRITKDKPKDVPITFIYGWNSWTRKECGFQIMCARKDVDVKVILNAGHNVFAERPDKFNKVLNVCLDKMDRERAHVKHGDKNAEAETDVEQDHITVV